VLLVRVVSRETVERIGVGHIHEDAWQGRWETIAIIWGYAGCWGRLGKL